MAKGKNVTISFRVSEGEAKLLRQRAKEHEMNESEYLRMMINQRPNDYPKVAALIKQLVNEVNHIGVNINQIVKNYNSSFYSVDDKNRLHAYMRKLNVTVKEVVTMLGNE